jgi:hypothetical protein
MHRAMAAQNVGGLSGVNKPFLPFWMSQPEPWSGNSPTALALMLGQVLFRRQHELDNPPGVTIRSYQHWFISGHSASVLPPKADIQDRGWNASTSTTVRFVSQAVH